MGGEGEIDCLTKMMSSLFQIHVIIDWFIRDLFRRMMQPTHEAIKFSRMIKKKTLCNFIRNYNQHHIVFVRLNVQAEYKNKVE